MECRGPRLQCLNKNNEIRKLLRPWGSCRTRLGLLRLIGLRLIGLRLLFLRQTILGLLSVGCSFAHSLLFLFLLLCKGSLALRGYSPAGNFARTLDIVPYGAQIINCFEGWVAVAVGSYGNRRLRVLISALFPQKRKMIRPCSVVWNLTTNQSPTTVLQSIIINPS